MGLCSTGGDFIVPGACHFTSRSWVFATEAALQSENSGGFLADIASGIRRYDPAYAAIEDYDNEYHAAQEGCSLSTIFGFAGSAVLADVETSSAKP